MQQVLMPLMEAVYSALGTGDCFPRTVEVVSTQLSILILSVPF